MIENNSSPMIHIITNYVTMNDLAQTTICYGGKPLMATHHDELREITSIASGLLINIGTLEPYTMESMEISMKVANDNNIPIVLDPVGVQASKLRLNFCVNLLKNHKISLLKGNLSEIKTLIGESTKHIGIDSLDTELSKDVTDKIDEFAKEIQAIVVVTGEKDYITNGHEAYFVYNGVSIMSDLTGTGCMLGAVLTTAIAMYDTNEDRLQAALRAVTSFGICGELALGSLNKKDGLLSFKLKMLDMINLITVEELSELGDFEKK
ncbi:MAG: hydroxyethylthiazole kinase [Clostridium sp.]